ncbi:MAG: aminotransferase class V-fold PLP-dependent enzyme [Gaiellaceae bacterium]
MTHAEARALFPVLERFAYLNAGTFDPLARATAGAMAEQALLDVEHGRAGQTYFEGMLGLRASVRKRIASLLRTTPDHVSLTSSTTDGCNIVLAGLDLQPNDEIVTTDAEHFGLAGPVFASGARVRVAPVGTSDGEELLAAIVSAVTPRTRLLAVSHVIWTTGAVLDVHALKERTGVPVLVDGAQSVGAIPVDVGALDFYTVSGQKWLCGPESTGALYVADPDSLRVASPSYFAQEAFEPGGEFVARAGAQRFDPGWTAVSALRGFDVALSLAPEWRFERIAALAALARESLPHVVTGPAQAGLVTFAAEGDPVALAARLFEQGVVLRNLSGTPWLRASCGWWNDDSDLERLRAGVGGGP